MRGIRSLKGKYVTVVTNYESTDNDGMNQASFGKLLKLNKYGLLLQDGDEVRWINLDIVDYIFQGNHLDVMHVKVPRISPGKDEYSQ